MAQDTVKEAGSGTSWKSDGRGAAPGVAGVLPSRLGDPKTRSSHSSHSSHSLMFGRGYAENTVKSLFGLLKSLKSRRL